jgi:primary-amine oxidase
LVFLGTLLLSFTAAAQSHPLAPLTTNELASAGEILLAEGKGNTNLLFPVISLQEPAKETVLAWKPGQPVSRAAFAMVLDRRENKAYEAVIDLKAKAVTSWKLVPGVQPLISSVEDAEAMDLTRNSPEWQAAIRRRGIMNFAEVTVIGWAPGHHHIKGLEGKRLYRMLSYHKGKQTNAYGPPIEGLEAIVDLNRSEVVRVIDTGVTPVGKESTDFYDENVRGTTRALLKPLVISQPQGPSFTITNSEIRWDRWHFRFGFDIREGLVIHQVSYADGGKERSVLYRGSVSELLVPYSAPDQTWYWRNAFDEGEYGLGKLSAPIEPGRGSPAHATLLDAALADDSGAGIVLTNRIAIYEREGDSLWNHWDYWSGTDGRRARELVIGFISTIGNYDYGFHWTFRQDGVIEFTTELMGVILTKGTALTRCQICQKTHGQPGHSEADGDERTGTLVAPNTIGVNHQHFVNVRLDMDVDGPANSVKEINVRALPGGKANPHQNAFVARQTVFGGEREAVRDVNVASHRHWIIFNPNITTALGHNPGYMLEPAANTLPFMSPDNVVRKFAGFVDHHFFATRYRATERHAAGPYPVHAPKPENVLTWTRDNESIQNQDVVIWYTLGLTHTPRPEDYPVMPAAKTGFRLVPKGFFTRNPGIDVPAPTAAQ